MIAVSSRGRSFHALAGYLTRTQGPASADRVAWTQTRNLPVSDPTMAAHFMAATADLSKRCQKPVYHLIISWDHDDHPDIDAMSDVADTVVDKIGLKDHEALYVAHQDKEHPHLHVMINRVSRETGKAWDKSFDFRAIRGVLRDKEHEHGFKPVSRAKDRSRAPSRADIAIAQREGKDPGRRMSRTSAQKLKEKLSPLFEKALSWADLDERLALRRYELTIAGAGVRIMRDGRYAKLSDLLPVGLTSKKLHRRLGDLKKYKKAKQRKLGRLSQSRVRHPTDEPIWDI